MAPSTVRLEDKYVLETGRIYLSGIQALVRLPLLQSARDKAAGLNTAGFISGYRGSPVGTYDSALMGAKGLLQEANIRFQPGLNEDLAATSIWGSQQLNLFEGAAVDGVFGIWYGKGPGVDRCGDVFKHANAAGTSQHGGVLAVFGDDHGSHSSTLPHQSEHILVAAMMPVLNPATIQDYLDFGQIGFALSRFSGCWVGLKATSQTIETSTSVEVSAGFPIIKNPVDFEMPPGGLNIRRPDPSLDQERRLHGPKMDAILAFARANGLDRLVFGDRGAKLGIVCAGKSYLDVREALHELGLDDIDATSLGIRLFKLGLTWPVEPNGIQAFADGLDEILVVEEKRGLIEDQVAKLLYNRSGTTRPRLVGKRDESGRILLPSEGELSPTLIGRVIAERVAKIRGPLPERLQRRLDRLSSLDNRTAQITPLVVRPPFFCSGCPHNTSTRLPEGSRGMAGIGCHGMIAFMPERNTHLWSHMGGEGIAWVGQAHFTKQKHIFQNLGDGTYSHSGLLAIRAAAASGVNITYKILFNDAVAMTGGQAVEGSLTVPQITRQVAAEGARRIVVVTDEPDKYPSDADFAPNVSIRPRDQLDAVQRELREIPGLTILIYDQTCAAEKRRRRKRGTFPNPPKRIFINTDVCEGCGDCSAKSNCISVQPIETEFGRKRVIHQSSCNKDYSCIEGFCPSFVTVQGGALRSLKPAAGPVPVDHDPPEPVAPTLEKPYSILVTGIGGTGVVTIGALLGMAAHIEGKGCSVLDSAGMAQKNGAVMSHIRIARSPDEIHAARIPAGAAGLVLACDMVVATSAGALGTVSHGATCAVVNSTLTPTAAFVTDNTIDFREAEMRRQISDAAGTDNVSFVDATGLATALMGDSIAANLFLLGYAFQRGLVPLGLQAITRAIELNGTAVADNLAAFAWGRRAAADPSSIEKAVKPKPSSPVRSADLDETIKRGSEFLEAYQDATYARKYVDFVDEVRNAERAKLRGRTELTETVAKNFRKLMAYKDEYEVARLHTDNSFRERLDAQFEGPYTVQYHFAPPLLARRDPITGELRKRTFGPWIGYLLGILARLRGLRGTPFDPFGYMSERRMERQLIVEYESTVRSMLASLSNENHQVAVQIANIPDSIRGFGHIKERKLRDARKKEALLLRQFGLHSQRSRGQQSALN